MAVMNPARPWGRSWVAGSRAASQPKRTSSEVSSLPSCHFMPGRSFQVTAMLPSVATLHVPASTEGSSAASQGRTSSFLSRSVR